jgi:uncharacterized SAM-binding protein YcdF (DUF218 family)
MDFFFLLKKLVGACLLPPASLLLLLLLGLLLIKRWPRTALTFIWVAFIGLFVLSLPVTARVLTATLDAPAFEKQFLKHAKVVVVLGGGIKQNTAEEGDLLSSASYARLRYGVRLARASDLPLLVTGGSVFGGTPEGEVMNRVAKEDFGLAPRWIENRSRDTNENMKFTAALLKPEHIKHVLIVTDDVHMRRSLTYCRAAGLECWSAPVTTFGNGSGWIEELPNAGALKHSAATIHELLGLLLLKYV